MQTLFMEQKSNSIPIHFSSLEEASDFGDTHDAGDYEKYYAL